MSREQEAGPSVHPGQRLDRDSGEVAASIAARWGVVCGHSGCLKLPGRPGFECKRPQGLPARADEAGFIEAHDELPNGLADDEAVDFADAVHPQYQSRPAHGRVRKGDKVALRRTSGRRRINLHGALDLQTFHCPLVEAERVDAASTIAPFEKLEADNPARKRIHVFADNARHHHARPVRQWPGRPGRRVKLIFLPACAPHLNAIGRSWGVMHRKVTHNRFHASFAPFAEAIDDSFQRRPPHEWRSWRDTITDNSRIISHKEFRALK